MTNRTPFEPDEFDRITAQLPNLSAWQAAWNQAAEELADTSIVEIYPEDIGRLAFELLPEHERDEALGALFYCWWAAMQNDREHLARVEGGEQ
ncbi:hypothetical protein [Streptomyces albus]|uniref:hypothetical protein n=1 Tax=Streptomyces albus TaxID=1888 RepID=UPI0024E123FB|nr:hypothetical protein [Streptomyces albus]GHJ21685.1 hypothetical protein TPA0909_32990 [Streptomyces albus]